MFYYFYLNQPRFINFEITARYLNYKYFRKRYLAKFKQAMNCAYQIRERYRLQQRNKRLEELKKTARFQISLNLLQQSLGQDVNFTIDKYEQAVELLDQIIKENNIAKLLDFLLSVDIKWTVAVLERKNILVDIVRKNIQQPIGVTLLNNLIYLSKQFIEQSFEWNLFPLIAKAMYQMREKMQTVEIYAENLCEHLIEPLLVSERQLEQAMPIIEGTFLALPTCSALIRLFACTTNILPLNQDILMMLISLDLKNTQAISNRFSVFCNFLRQRKTSFKSLKESRQMVNFLITSYNNIPAKVRCEQMDLFQCLIHLVEKCDIEISEQLLMNDKLELLSNYRYGKKEYYELIIRILKKVNLNLQTLQQLQQKQFIQNVVFDINDVNSEIGYYCLQILQPIVAQTTLDYVNQFQEILDSKGIVQNMINFYEDNRSKTKQMLKLCESMIQMIKKDKNI